MPEIDYQGILDELLKVLPQFWDQFTFVANYKGDDDYDMICRVFDKTDDDKWKYTDLPADINDPSIKDKCIDVFANIHKLLRPVRAALEDINPKQKWSKFTMNVNHDGQMHADFGYEEINEFGNGGDSIFNDSTNDADGSFGIEEATKKFKDECVIYINQGSYNGKSHWSADQVCDSKNEAENLINMYMKDGKSPKSRDMYMIVRHQPGTKIQSWIKLPQ